MNRVRALVVGAPLALVAMVILSVIGIAATAEEGGEDGKIQNLAKRRKIAAHAFAKGKGTAKVLFDAESGAEELSMSEILLAPGGEIPLRIDSDSATYIYLSEGAAKVTFRGRQRGMEPGDAAYIPAGTQWALRAGGRLVPTRALIIHAKPGPEQRFRLGEVVPSE